MEETPTELEEGETPNLIDSKEPDIIATLDDDPEPLEDNRDEERQVDDDVDKFLQRNAVARHRRDRSSFRRLVASFC